MWWHAVNISASASLQLGTLPFRMVRSAAPTVRCTAEEKKVTFTVQHQDDGKKPTMFHHCWSKQEENIQVLPQLHELKMDFNFFKLDLILLNIQQIIHYLLLQIEKWSVVRSVHTGAFHEEQLTFVFTELDPHDLHDSCSAGSRFSALTWTLRRYTNICPTPARRHQATPLEQTRCVCFRVIDKFRCIIQAFRISKQIRLDLCLCHKCARRNK